MPLSHKTELTFNQGTKLTVIPLPRAEERCDPKPCRQQGGPQLSQDIRKTSDYYLSRSRYDATGEITIWRGSERSLIWRGPERPLSSAAGNTPYLARTVRLPVRRGQWGPYMMRSSIPWDAPSWDVSLRDTSTWNVFLWDREMHLSEMGLAGYLLVRCP